MLRLDKYLVEKEFFPSREKAQDAILQETVKVNGIIIDKPSKTVDDSDSIEIIDIFNRYVSRGGLKLEKAILDFNLDFQNKTILDVGASTGGFTDCALKHGASQAVCVDVGTAQMHPFLANHPNIVSIENKDFRELTPADVGGRTFDFIVADVSFISLSYLFPYFSQFLKEDTLLMLLIKPQFEAGASFLNRSGIVSDEKGYKVAIQKVEKEALNHGYFLNNLSISTLYEINKNVEFLSLFSMKNNHYTVNFPKLMTELKEVKKRVKKQA